MRSRRLPLPVAAMLVIAAFVAACSPAVAAPNPSWPASPSTRFTDAEAALLKLIRPDARRSCEPRRSDLPVGALASVECHPATGPASRVGAYRFATDQDAARAYFARLVAEGVARRSGDCYSGIEGDSAWTPGDDVGEVRAGDPQGVVVDGIPYIVFRSGCFKNDDGVPNFRATCGNGAYVGVLGRTGDLRELVRWSWRNAPDAPASTPGAPGICYYPA